MLKPMTTILNISELTLVISLTTYLMAEILNDFTKINEKLFNITETILVILIRVSATLTILLGFFKYILNL